MKRIDPTGLKDFLAERDTGQDPAGTFFQGTVTGIRGSFPQFDVQVQRTGDPAPDGHWHKCATPGYTPQLGDVIDLVKRDETFAHVAAPLSPAAFVSQGWARLAPPVLLAGPAASVGFSAIPQTFTHLIGSWRARSTSGSATTLLLRLNNDSATNYNGEIVQTLSATTTASLNLSQNAQRIGGLGTTGTLMAAGWFWIMDYARTDTRRMLTWYGWRNDGGGTGIEHGAGDWANTTDGVNSLTFLSGSNNLDTAALFNLYGA